MMHTWTYRRNEKAHFLLRLHIGKKKLAACLLHNIDIAFVSECLCHLRASGVTDGGGRGARRPPGKLNVKNGFPQRFHELQNMKVLLQFLEICWS